MKKPDLNKIVSLVHLEHMLRTIAKSSGMNLCMIDLLGHTIIPPTNDTAFCEQVRKDQKQKELCLWCATHAALEAVQRKQPFFYKCAYGLVDFAVPVFYHDEVIGAIFGGELKIDNCDNDIQFAYPLMPINENLQPYHDSIQPSSFDRILYTSKLLTQIVDNLDSFNIVFNAPKNNVAEQMHLKKLQPAIDYIKLNFNKNFSLADLAKICCVSESYMSKMFRTTMKCSITEFTTDLRIEKAKELLKDPSNKMLAIAYETGYCDCAHFTKKFKQHTGMTPSEYRNLAI